MKQPVRPGNIFIIVLILSAIAIGIVSYFKLNLPVYRLPIESKQTQQPQLSPSISNTQLESYNSQDLKIFFDYPKSWFVDEKDYDIMITSYPTKIGENKPPSENEIKIFIDNYSGCFPTLEEDLIDPACGQGKTKNKIISKEVRQTSGGEFIKYTLESYDENQRIQYFFRKDETILDIEKHPDPSQFEKEFETIVNSIQFLK